MIDDGWWMMIGQQMMMMGSRIDDCWLMQGWGCTNKVVAAFNQKGNDEEQLKNLSFNIQWDQIFYYRAIDHALSATFFIFMDQVVIARLEELVRIKRRKAFQHCFVKAYQHTDSPLEDSLHHCLDVYQNGLKVMESAFARYVRTKAK